MRYKLEKTMQIADDLMLYCCTLGATKYHIDYITEKDKHTFILQVEIENLPDMVLIELHKALNKSRSREVEEIYWAINYDSDSPCELVMLGMMLDEAKAEYFNNILTITAVRKD